MPPLSAMAGRPGGPGRGGWGRARSPGGAGGLRGGSLGSRLCGWKQTELGYGVCLSHVPPTALPPLAPPDARSAGSESPQPCARSCAALREPRCAPEGEGGRVAPRAPPSGLQTAWHFPASNLAWPPRRVRWSARPGPPEEFPGHLNEPGSRGKLACPVTFTDCRGTPKGDPLGTEGPPLR